MKRMVMGALPLMLVAGLAVGHAALAQERDAPSPSVAALLSTGKTILGQPLTYPDGAPARVTSAIVTLPLGAQTGWHRHDVPVFGYVLDGELTVTYEGTGDRVYRTGEAFMEAIGTRHNGRNTGTGPAHILAVFIGADGIQNTVKSE
jgi:quercetin dioxygenase-like cupin family protein